MSYASTRVRKKWPHLQREDIFKRFKAYIYHKTQPVDNSDLKINKSPQKSMKKRQRCVTCSYIFGLFIKCHSYPIEIHFLQKVRQQNKSSQLLDACLKTQVQCLPKEASKTKSLSYMNLSNIYVKYNERKVSRLPSTAQLIGRKIPQSNSNG